MSHWAGKRNLVPTLRCSSYLFFAKSEKNNLTDLRLVCIGYDDIVMALLSNFSITGEEQKYAKFYK